MKDSILGYKLIPNLIKKKSTAILRGDTIYNVFYSSDKFGRRVAEDEFHDDTLRKIGVKKKHAIFLGCSHTFGEGLNYDATFPGIFEQEHPDFKSYNYGVKGYGPHQTCLLFDEGINTINKYSVPEDSGFCIYSYIDDHLNRVYGSSSYLKFAEMTPDVYVDNNNRLVIKKRSYLQTHIAYFLNNSETMKYLNISFNYPKNEKFYKRFADLINYMAVKYWDIKPHGEFYVGLYQDIYGLIDSSWIKYLDKRIKILHVPALKDIATNPTYTIKYDGHPTKKLNLYYVDEISKLMFKNE